MKDEIIPFELGSVLLVGVVPDIHQHALCFPQDLPKCSVLALGSYLCPAKPGREKMPKEILLFEEICHLRKKDIFLFKFHVLF